MGDAVAEVWRDFFVNWPANLARRGVAIASYNEQIPFVDFLTRNDVVVLERATPDAVGGRRVVLPFARIEALKYTEPLKTQQLVSAGFQGSTEKKSAPKAVAATA